MIEDPGVPRRTVLVTGASRGIGGAIARRFAAEAYLVLANDLAAQAPALGVLREAIVAAGGRCELAPADVSDPGSVAAMVEKAIADHGAIGVLVNNAGVISNHRIEEIEPDEWDRMFRVNTRGAFLVCKAMLPHFRARRSGRIINIASIGGKLGAVGQAHYAASKAAVINFTHVLAQETGRDGITVNAVCPGIVDTEMWQIWLRDHSAEEAAPDQRTDRSRPPRPAGGRRWRRALPCHGRCCVHHGPGDQRRRGHHFSLKARTPTTGALPASQKSSASPESCHASSTVWRFSW